MARTPALNLRVEITGARQTLAAFRALPKEASNALRDASLELSRTLATRVQGAARSSSRQSALVAPTIKARRDRLPSIVVGGTSRVGRNRVPANKVLFGANFGARVLPQFRPHRGAGSNDYWFFSTVEREQATIAAAWDDAAQEIIRSFGRGG